MTTSAILQLRIERLEGQRGKFDPEAFDEQRVKFANPAPRLKRLLAYLASRI